MNTPITGTEIAQDRIDRFRSFGAFGKPAWQSHVQLRALIRQRLGDDCANYFAVPTYDPDTGVIRWTAPAGGAVRTWHEMSPDEQALHGLDMEVIRSKLVKFAADLRGEQKGPPGTATAFASLLDQAMKVPAGGNFLFMAGNQPVIAFWGFEDPTAGAVDPWVPPRITPTPLPGPLPSAASAPAVMAAAPPVAVAAVPARKRAWWWWLLLALLLLGLLLLLLRSCGPDGSVDLRRAVPGLAPPDAPASVPGADPAVPVRPGGQVDLPQAPGTTVPGAVDPSAPAASMPGLAMPPDLAASVPGGVDAVDPAKTDPKLDPKLDPKADPKADPKLDPKTDPKTDPPVPDRSKDPKADPSKDPKADPSKNDKRAGDPPKPGTDPKSLNLPADPKAANKLDFLQGDWKAGEGLVDKTTKQPLDLGLKFNKDGQGELTLRRPDGTVCSGPVQGRMNGGKLSIEGNQAVPCAGGGSYGAPKLECTRSSSGQTDCQGINRDGSRYYMDMRRQ